MPYNIIIRDRVVTALLNLFQKETFSELLKRATSYYYQIAKENNSPPTWLPARIR